MNIQRKQVSVMIENGTKCNIINTSTLSANIQVVCRYVVSHIIY